MSQTSQNNLDNAAANFLTRTLLALLAEAHQDYLERQDRSSAAASFSSGYFNDDNGGSSDEERTEFNDSEESDAGRSGDSIPTRTFIVAKNRSYWRHYNLYSLVPILYPSKKNAKYGNYYLQLGMLLPQLNRFPDNTVVRLNNVMFFQKGFAFTLTDSKSRTQFSFRFFTSTKHYDELRKTLDAKMLRGNLTITDDHPRDFLDDYRKQRDIHETAVLQEVFRDIPANDLHDSDALLEELLAAKQSLLFDFSMFRADGLRLLALLADLECNVHSVDFEKEYKPLLIKYLLVRLGCKKAGKLPSSIEVPKRATYLTPLHSTSG